MNLIGVLLFAAAMANLVTAIRDRVRERSKLDALYWHVHALEREVEAQTLKGYFRPCTCGGCRRTRAHLGLAQLR